MIIPIHSDRGDYDVVLERGALQKAGDFLRLGRRALIVTDSGVPGAYSEAIAACCKESQTAVVPEGEGSKCFRELERLLSAMLARSFERDDCVVAVGGGVAGDLAGFAASCYMRGIDFYNVPTTLLSEVDSSIGGKTAIDLDGVKNAVGAFYQPRRVLIDPDTLSTLAPRELRAGLAEAIKMAATSDEALFGLIERSRDIYSDLPEIIERSLLIKKAVVEEDPREKGKRRILNFGHTIGHAIESAGGGKLLHGECVALGMLPMCGEGARERLADTLERHGLPTRISQSADELMPYIVHDKKMKGKMITAVFVDKIGSCELRRIGTDGLRMRLEANA